MGIFNSKQATEQRITDAVFSKVRFSDELRGPMGHSTEGRPGDRGRQGMTGRAGQMGPVGRQGNAGHVGLTGPVGPRGLPCKPTHPDEMSMLVNGHVIKMSDANPDSLRTYEKKLKEWEATSEQQTRQMEEMVAQHAADLQAIKARNTELEEEHIRSARELVERSNTAATESDIAHVAEVDHENREDNTSIGDTASSSRVDDAYLFSIV
jgi:hypothetical protein